MPLLGAELFLAFGQAEELTDMTKVVLIFHNYAKWRKRRELLFVIQIKKRKNK
jgi:hypothetical protein